MRTEVLERVDRDESLRRLCKRDPQVLVCNSLYDTNEDCVVEIDLWWWRYERSRRTLCAAVAMV